MKKTRDQVLREIDEAFQAKHAAADQLLWNIKENRIKIEECLAENKDFEPDIVYRFYQQSFKVFDAKRVIDRSVELFERLSPASQSLNEWFTLIVEEAKSKEFDWEKTNPIWLEETRPILEALWHCRYFQEQMLVASDTLDSTPSILPFGWAAVLYLYDLR
jgi:hypothetical protein